MNIKPLLVRWWHTINLSIMKVRARMSNDLGVCAKCETGEYLTLSLAIADIYCQGCGEWQEATLNDVYARVDL